MIFNNRPFVPNCPKSHSLVLPEVVHLNNRNCNCLSKSILFAVIFILWIIAPIEHAASQGFVIDTTRFLNESNGNLIVPESSIYESSMYEDEVLPEDEERPTMEESIFIPSGVLYKDRWDTLYIRTGKFNLAETHDSTFLWLSNPSETKFHFPYKGKLLSKYGWRSGRFHAGMDVKLETGDTVVSSFDGRVRIARVMSGYGKMVVVRHNNGLETVYAHLSKIIVNINDEVKAGQPLGLGGRTGRATTSHLHFETRYLGEHFNPDRIIDFENFTLIRDTLLINKEFWHPLKATTVASAHDEKSVSQKYHTIKSGDTLSTIARKYKTSVKRICQLNGIKETKLLQLGKRLRVS